MPEETWKKRYVGISLDHRTNRWVITCPSGHSWEPATTMMRFCAVSCPRCHPERRVTVDYDGPDEWTVLREDVVSSG